MPTTPLTQKKRVFLYVLLIALAFFALIRLYYRLTDDFRLANITDTLNYRSEWDVQPLTSAEKEKIDTLLQQKYFYIGKGAQSYAFGSEDGQFVLKFFKFKHLRPSPLFDWIPPWMPFAEYRAKQEARKKRKFEGVFSGYHLAYEVNRKESGLLFVHLNRTKELYPSVTVFDKIGRKHRIDLDDVAFLLQVKAETMRSVLHRLLEQGDLPLAKTRISQIFDLYLSEYKKGIFDHDHGVMHNAGFSENHPIHLDVGKLKKDENMKSLTFYSEDLALVARRMDKWLKENELKEYPELAKHIEAKVSEITQAPFKL